MVGLLEIFKVELLADVLIGSRGEMANWIDKRVDGEQCPPAVLCRDLDSFDRICISDFE